MRVLHVLHTSLPVVAGYTIRSDNIMRFQRELGIEAAAVTSGRHPNGETLHEDINGFSFWRTEPLTGKQPVGVRELRLMYTLEKRVEQVIREWRPQVVHAHSPMLVGIPALRAARRHGIAMVYELRDLWENPSVDRGKFKDGSLQYRLAQEAENYVLRRADALVTICQSLKDAIVPRAGKHDAVHVVDNGVDVTRFTPRAPSDALRARFGLEGKRVLAYIGTFEPWEGLELMVRAMPAIIREVPEALLLVVGGGGEEPTLRKLVHEIGASSCVTFTGRIAHHEVVDVYPLGDLLVYPRILTRTTALTTPLKPLEAMAMGRAVLVSDIAPMRELVRPGETGFVFRAGDIADLQAVCIDTLRDHARRERIGEAGRASALQDRTWPNLVARYPGIYEKAIARAKSKPPVLPAGLA